MFKLRTKGFTLVELMVSISIIMLLSTLVLSGVAGTRKSARVLQRIADLKQVQGALERYYANNKSYPVSVGQTWSSVCPAWGGLSPNAVIPGLAPAYINTIPVDPQTAANSNSNCYIYASNGTDYALLDHWVTELEAGNSGATYLKYPELVDPARDGGSSTSIVDGAGVWAWKVSSPGARVW
ncbi:MAG: type II secretion system protein [Candidatus Zambryskibacteria bacterium]|nr:type II secretion system protein [Candidatus Zambryskibacteria bacterium]